MKIIEVDNFARDYIDDKLWVEKVEEREGRILVGILNQTFSRIDSPTFFRLVSDDYKLNKFNP